MPEKRFTPGEKKYRHAKISQVTDKLLPRFGIHLPGQLLSTGISITMDAAQITLPGAIPDNHGTR